MEADFIEFATTNLAKPLEDYDENDHVIDEVLNDYQIALTFLPELQKAFNLPQGKIFKVFKPTSKYCKVGLTNQKIRMNLENNSLLYHKSL